MVFTCDVTRRYRKGGAIDRRFWYEQCISRPQVRARDGRQQGNTVQAESGSHSKPGQGEWLLAAKWVPSTANSPEDMPQKCAAGRDVVQAVPFCI